MKLNKITNTCSMFELGDFQSFCHPNYSKNKFYNFIRREFEILGVNKYCENYSIIYNCTSDKNYKLLRKLGFKQISRYKGWDSSNDVKVLIWKSEKYTFFERIKIFFKLR